MATVRNLTNPGVMDRSYTSPNRKVTALDVPLYAGEIVLNTTDQKCYVAVPPLAQGAVTATDWVLFSYGLGLN